MKTILAAAVVLVGFVSCAIWAVQAGHLDRFVVMAGVFYGALILAFLTVLLWAFVKAHIDYDEGIEAPKFAILEMERKDTHR